MIPYTAETTANVPASGYSTDGSMSAASLFGGAGGDGGASGGDGGCGGAGGAIVTRAVSATSNVNPALGNPSFANDSMSASPFDRVSALIAVVPSRYKNSGSVYDRDSTDTVSRTATFGASLSNASAVAGAAPSATSARMARVRSDKSAGVVMSPSSRVGFKIDDPSVSKRASASSSATST